MLFPIMGIAQKSPCTPAKVGIGIIGGYSSTKDVEAEGYIAYKITPWLIAYPVALKIMGSPSMRRNPKIYEPRIGFKYQRIETYLGYGYNAGMYTDPKGKEQFTGWKPAAGVILHPYGDLVVSAGLSGSIKTIGAGIFKCF